jgi:hypothetical protein
LGLLATGVGSDETAGAGISTRSVLTLTSITGLGFFRGSLLALTLYQRQESLLSRLQI